jgi:hypothetical protein
MVETARRSGTADLVLIRDLNAMYVTLCNDRALRGGICILMTAAATAVGRCFVRRSTDNRVKGGIDLACQQFDSADMLQYLNS